MIESPHGSATTHFPGFALTIWDVDRRSVAVNDPGKVWGATFSPDGRRFACGHWNGEVVTYDLATGQPWRRWPGPALVLDLAFRPDGAQVAIMYNDPKSPTCRILESDTGRIVLSIPLPISGSIAWSPDGTTLATGCDDSKIYLWDAATGTLKAILEGSTNGGLFAAFHPSGTLLASNSWESRWRLWDAVLGRPMLSLTGGSSLSAFSRDGRIVVSLEDRLTTYQVDPALAYRSLAYNVGRLKGFQRSSVRHDGRVLAVATSQGMVLWDLASGVELAYLRIGRCEQPIFEASGDLITSGTLGVMRWPVHLSTDRGEFRIGPPIPLPLPAGSGTFAEDRQGRIVAVAYRDHALVTTPERTIRVGPLSDCRAVAISPNGEWLATGYLGTQIWRIGDSAPVADLGVERLTEVFFSPDGKWLMTSPAPCKLWSVGAWREDPREIGGLGLCFSSDGRLLVVQDASKTLRLVETGSGRTLARLDSPDSCEAKWATFTPDGSRLIVSTPESPGVRVWDLRAIRRHLASLGLDWEAPSYSDADPAAPSMPPLPKLQVDLGPLVSPTQSISDPAGVPVVR